MHALKEARKFIEKDPFDPAAQTLSRLVLALESEADFPIADIYLLDYSNFKIALQILEEWRLDRHYAGKSKLLDTSRQAADANLGKPAAASESAAAPAKAKNGKSTDDKTDSKPEAVAAPAKTEAAADKKQPAKTKAASKRGKSDAS